MRFHVCLAALAASVAVVSPALAQAVPPPPITDFDTATARGVVLGAHSLKKSRDLDFGVVAVDPASVGGGESLGPARDSELAEHTREVKLDRLLCEPEPLPDLPVRQAVGERIQALKS